MLDFSKVNENPVILYPKKMWDILTRTGTRKVFASSINLNTEVVPGLFISCKSNDLGFFKIGMPPPEPSFKFKFYDISFGYPSGLIEIILQFPNKHEMFLHLNPAHENIRYFFKKVISTKLISFHYYKIGSSLIISSFTEIPDEELQWFIRNNKKLNNLIYSKRDFTYISETISEDLNSHQILYNFKDIKSREILADYSKNLIKINNKTEPKEFIYNEN